VCNVCSVPLHKWHGDVSGAAKRRSGDRPSGVLLITPESLEAMLVRRGKDSTRLFRNVEAFVVDELHAFIGTERGVQLQSILSRIEIAVGREHIDRVGLSATLGDMRLASATLRPRAVLPATIVEGLDPGNGLKMQIRGYVEVRRDTRTSAWADSKDDSSRRIAGPNGTVNTDPENEPLVPPAVAADLFRVLRGRSNLLFAGSRARVEAYADALRMMSEEQGLPNEFFPHHGSLSKPEREDVEARLRDDPRPTTAVATTTLELGIDIGDVETIAQIGPGLSVASLRQRLGRSGRRPGKAAVLRIFVIETDPRPGDYPLDLLHLDLVQAIAMVEALREGWCEPPVPKGLHLSTLMHQILALIVQTGGLTASACYRVLCERGAFVTVDKSLFSRLLRAMAAPERALIEQSRDGLLMVGGGGEKITEAHDFYTVFATEVEYRVVASGRTLGTHPVDVAIAAGQTLIFAGRRWHILSIDDDARVIEVKPSRHGRPPSFKGSWGGIHDHVVATMRRVLLAQDLPVYLDAPAKELLAAARQAFRSLQLHERAIVPWGNGSLIVPWLGTKKLTTLALTLNASGSDESDVDASPVGHAIEMPKTPPDTVGRLLSRLATDAPLEPTKIAERAAKPQLAKFDHLLPTDLMALVTVVERLDVMSVPAAAFWTINLADGPDRDEQVPTSDEVHPKW
jgi:ATP-dependent Lhr-like helicase